MSTLAAALQRKWWEVRDDEREEVKKKKQQQPAACGNIPRNFNVQLSYDSVIDHTVLVLVLKRKFIINDNNNFSNNN